MRSFLTLGSISLVTVAAFVACGDDSNGPSNTAGTGGSAGASGSAGSAGSAGTAGAGGGAGTSSGGSAGSSGGTGVVTPSPIATCAGCVEIAVPVSGANDTTNLADQASFQFTFPTPGADFSNGVVTWRVMALEDNDNFFVRAYAGNGPPDSYSANTYPSTAPAYYTLSAANFPANTWKDITLDLRTYAAVPSADAGTDAGDAGGSVVADAGDAGDAGGGIVTGNGFNKARVQALGLQLGTGTAFTGSGIIRMAIDSVTIAGVAGQADHTFTTDAEGLTLNNYEVPPGTPAAPFHH